MRTVARLVLGCCLFTACNPQLNVPDGASLSCTSSSDCPEGYACRETVGRCIESDNLGDIAPPELVGSAALSSVGKAGTVLSVAFDVNEELLTDPEVVAELRTSTVRWQRDASASSGLHYAYTYVVAGDEPEGTGQVYVSMTDLATNQARGLYLGAFNLDFTAPQLISARPSAAAFRAGDTIVYTINVSESLQEPDGRPLVVVRQGGVVATGFFAAPDIETDTSFAWVRDLGGLTDGPFTVEVTLVDAAGNSATSLPGDGFGVDASVPSITLLAATPARLNASSTLTVTFDSDEEVAVDDLQVTVGGRPMSCGAYQPAPASPSYTCTRPMTGGEIAPNSEVAQTVLVKAADAAGNVGEGSISVLFDFKAPEVAFAALAYLPGPNNPLGLVRAATAGTTIQVQVVANEALTLAFEPTLSATFGATTLSFDTLAHDEGGASFEVMVPEGATSGDYAPLLSWTDVAGNANDSASFATPPVQVKTSVPSLTVAQTQVSYYRSPWGNGASECICPTPAAGCVIDDDEDTCTGHFIPAGPYFALAPAEPLTSSRRLLASTFMLGAVAPTQIRIFADNLGLSLLGTATPGSDQTWPRQRLANLDAPYAYVTGLDLAGNESTPIKLDTSEWVATPNVQGFGESPNRLEKTPHATRARDSDLHVVVASGSVGSSRDGVGVEAEAEPVWRAKKSDQPSERWGASAAYDSARGRMVMFGGDVGGNTDELWEWDGDTWHAVARQVVWPSARASHRLAYDSGRGRVVLFGGTDTTHRDDLWEWDGSTWTGPLTPTPRPDPRAGHGMAYDSNRARVVIFGGNGGSYLDDVWEWDGSSWTPFNSLSTRPPARLDSAMAYDSQRGVTVLFGGRVGLTEMDDVWEWNGSAWSGPLTTGPSGRWGHGMTFDRQMQQVLVFTGRDAPTKKSDLWAWDGTTWTEPPTLSTSPPPREQPVMVYDDARGRSVVFGGLDGSSFDDLWEWDGVDWFGPTQPDEQPFVLIAPGGAYDSVRGVTVIFGGGFGAGYRDELWEWNGSSWRGPLTPSPRPSGRTTLMAFDSGRGVSVLFGGIESAGPSAFKDDVWEWNGSVWIGPLTPTPRPSARDEHALAYDSFNERVVMFGGRGASFAIEDDVWLWDGSVWTGPLRPTPRPSARYGAAMAYDSDRQVTVLFGGLDLNYSLCDDVWEWDGSAWDGPLPATIRPSARLGARLAYDSDRQRTVLFAGQAGNGVKESDVWEWDGDSWSGPWVPVERPSARSTHVMVYDADRGHVVVQGGVDASGALNDLWELDTSPTRRPGLEFTASYASAGFSKAAVKGLQVRAYCGGDYSPFGSTDHGAALLGWVPQGPLPLPPGSWVSLASAAADRSLLPASEALLSWTASTAAEAQRYLFSTSRQITFRCEPDGDSGAGTAAVALDYLEVRVRY